MNLQEKVTPHRMQEGWSGPHAPVYTEVQTLPQRSFISARVYHLTISEASHLAVDCSCREHQESLNRHLHVCEHMLEFEETRLAYLRMMREDY